MVSILDLVSMIFFSLFNNYITTSAKWLGGIAINVYRNHGSFCIGSAFSFKIFCKIDTVALSFVFDKYCSIIN